MNPIFESLAASLDRGGASDIARQLGVDEAQAAQALSAAVPALTMALARQARSSDGSQGLLSALRDDHDGSILESSPPGYGSHPQAWRGAGVLEHALGGRQRAVAQGVSRASGLSMSKVMQLLVMIAPMVMGALGKARADRDVKTGGGLGDILGGALGELGGILGQGGTPDDQAPPQQRSPGGITDILDSDDDGKIADDIARIGAAVLGSGILGKLAGKRS